MMVQHNRLKPASFANARVVNNSLVIEHRECVALAERLLALLQYEWEANHSEHCSNIWPHPENRQGKCAWPPPPELSLFVPAD
jgi:hypothetical protein